MGGAYVRGVKNNPPGTFFRSWGDHNLPAPSRPIGILGPFGTATNIRAPFGALPVFLAHQREDERVANRWPMATAAASAASVGSGSFRLRSIITILPTWVLSAQP